MSQWADKHFYLSAESSYVEQKWKAYPFQRGMLDMMGHDAIEDFDCMKSARVGYTKMLMAAVGYFAQHKRRNSVIYQPTDGDSDDFCKDEVEPMLRDVKIMRDVFPNYLRRHKDNTLQKKKGLGVAIHLKGGTAAKNYRRISVDASIMDEVDAFVQDVEKEGSPKILAGKRTEGATFPKRIRGSTPKIKNFSMIEAGWEEAEKRFKFYIPCPHCGEMIALQWGGKDKSYGFKWIDNDPETVAHCCDKCAGLFTQSDYLQVWDLGRWIAQDGTWYDDKNGVFRDSVGIEVPAPLSVAVHVWTAYSPQTTWVKIVREFIAANEKAKSGNDSELKSFVNTTLGETWEAEVEQTDESELKRRAEDYPLGVVPMGGLILGAGVDVQSNRFEVVTYAFGIGEEMWAVDYKKIDANPAVQSEWNKLADYLDKPIKHASGSMLKIEAEAVDTGGHFTHQAYIFSRHRKKTYAIKGDSQPGKPIKARRSWVDINHNGRTLKKGCKLWMVGTDTAKDLIFGRLGVPTPGPGYIHFSKQLPDEFYQQLVAEVRIMVRSNASEQYKWVKKKAGIRNEVLDCTVYALFIAEVLELRTYSKKRWEQLELAVQPLIQDLFSKPEVEKEVIPEKQTPPAKQASGQDWIGTGTGDWI